MLQGAQSVYITTNLWSSCNDEPYIGITAGWLNPIDWTLKEALLACEKINGKHTDNGPNIVKAI
ncbi:4250_t:CDS:2 [Funneliformis geosporum]|uniref:4250_t:CDS:1 n=1 Tax=Funneliformis geosporum TaxID=1117311 RepID=A0A9W4SV89_9GLOM|nr:4250_t:CDS:2 [Funneliformis geosporum]